MSYYGVYRQCFRFREVWRSNVHDVEKVHLETTLCVNVCFVEFYMFVLDEINTAGPKLL